MERAARRVQSCCPPLLGRRSTVSGGGQRSGDTCNPRPASLSLAEGRPSHRTPGAPIRREKSVRAHVRPVDDYHVMWEWLSLVVTVWLALLRDRHALLLENLLLR